MTYNDLDLTVLKVIFENKKCAMEFSSQSDSSIFTQDLWRFSKIVTEYLKLYKECPTRKVLLDVYAKGNESSAKYINEVCDAVDAVPLNDKEFKHNLNQLKDRYARTLIDAVRESLTDAPEGQDIDKTVKTIQGTIERVRGLYKNKVFNQKTVKDSVKEFKSTYNAKMKDPNFGRGILTGFSFIDFATNGLRPGELILVAGESGSGKSTLLLNMAINMWMQQNKLDTPTEEYRPGYNVVFFSLEMPHEVCLNRTISKVAQIPYRGIRDGSLSRENTDKLSKGLKFINNYPYEFEIVDIPRGATAEQIEMIIEDAKLRFSPSVIVVDYLGIMDYEGGDKLDDWLKLGKISESLHELARVQNMCVLSAVQLNRMAKGKDGGGETIGMHRIGRSQLIVTNANIAIQIEKRNEEQLHPDMIAHFIKNRDGELVKGRLIKDFNRCSLSNDFEDSAQEVADTEDISARLGSIK